MPPKQKSNVSCKANMSGRRIVSYAWTGAMYGLLLAVISIIANTRRIIQRGIYVDTIHLQRNKPLETLLAKLRPLCQTGRFAVHRNYKEFIRRIDILVGAALATRDQRAMDCTSLLAPGYKHELMTLLQHAVAQPSPLYAELEPAIAREVGRLICILPGAPPI